MVSLPALDVRHYIPPKNVHGILAAPPCTQFSLARTNAKTPRNFGEAMDVVNACFGIIQACRLNGSLKWWALENPLGYLRQFIGCPPFTFNPYDFGDAWTKPTDLWGYYTKLEFRYTRAKFNLDQAKDKLEKIAGTLTLRRPKVKLRAADILAITPQGFAKAFFKANP